MIWVDEKVVLNEPLPAAVETRSVLLFTRRRECSVRFQVSEVQRLGCGKCGWCFIGVSATGRLGLFLEFYPSVCLPNDAITRRKGRRRERRLSCSGPSS
jgi:hypothetical protein